MKVPLNWLKEYVDITLSPEDLAHTLTMAGMEVEAIEYIGESWGDKIITAQITHLEKVEGSDHLSYTHVNTGSQVLNVICGAPNIRLGDKVPLALPGAQVGDITISETRKMGYTSQGMLCSPRELGLGNDHSGIYILNPRTELGVKLVDLLGEVVLDFSIKAHRGDLSSIVGIAREVSALTRQPLRIPPTVLQEQGTPVSDLVKVTNEAPDLCRRYTARVISNIKPGQSPTWMGQRLLAAGMRPINNIVDITNYVMLELGQPLHAFDYEKVPDHHILVRRARPGETMKTLDDIERKLNPEMLLITDPAGPTAIAGVMGGAVSEVSDTTTTILLESANFKASSVRRTSSTLGLRTDASSRFEKGLDPELAIVAANRAAQLMVELAGGTIHPGVVDNYPEPARPVTLSFSTDEVEWLTSIKVTQDEAADALRRLDFVVEQDEQGRRMRVTVPGYRGDIEEGADLVEEVIRLIGYDKIPSTIPTGPLPEQSVDSWFAREQEMRNLLIGTGLSEIITYSLTSRARMVNLLAQADTQSARYLLQTPGGAPRSSLLIAEESQKDELALVPFDPHTIPAVTLSNSLSSEMEVLRLTLMSGLLETVQANSKRSRSGLRFFELGRRYLPADNSREQPDERRTAGIALCGPAEISWHGDLARPADFYDLKGIVETVLEGLKISGYRFTQTQHPTFHPGRCAFIELLHTNDAGVETYSPVGILGEIHPLVQQRYDLPHRTYIAELDLAHLFAAVPDWVAYQPVSRHQGLTRDLALIVDQQIPSDAVEQIIVQNGGELLRSVALFDVYTGEPVPAGKKNLTYTLLYQAQNKTLIDAEANTLQDRIIQALNEQVGATLR